jgi:hypothetical protein
MTNTTQRPKLREAGRAAAGAEQVLSWVQQGVRAEQAVARALRRLLRARPFFYVVNALPLGRSDIDHIVVGPTGVFAIETKGYAGAVRITNGALKRNGFPPDEDPLRQARRAAAVVCEWLRRRGLDIRRVQPVLCLPYADLDRPQCIGGVLVTRREHLGYLVRHWQGQQLDEAHAARVFAALQRKIQPAAA